MEINKIGQTTVVNTDNDAVSTTSETLQIRICTLKIVAACKHEQELREMRYKIEDAIWRS